MKKIITIIISIMMSTTIVFASPGMENYSLERQKRIDKIRNQFKASQKNMISIIDRAILRLEKSKSGDPVSKSQLKTIFRKLDKKLAMSAKHAAKLLENDNERIRDYNYSVALNPELTQYEHRQILIRMRDFNQHDKLKAGIRKQVEEAGSYLNFLIDIRDSLNKDRMVNFNSNKKSRKIASISCEDFLAKQTSIQVLGFGILVLGLIIGSALLPMVGGFIFLAIAAVGPFVTLAGMGEKHPNGLYCQ